MTDEQVLAAIAHAFIARINDYRSHEAGVELAKLLAQVRAETVERCAQVVEIGWIDRLEHVAEAATCVAQLRHVAAAIREGRVIVSLDGKTSV